MISIMIFKYTVHLSEGLDEIVQVKPDRKIGYYGKSILY